MFFFFLFFLVSVFVLDTGLHVFVWVGKEATTHEKGGGLVIAHVRHSYLFKKSICMKYNLAWVGYKMIILVDSICVCILYRNM